MPKEYSRSERVADFIKREVALLLQRELRDPRVSNANVNAVVVSRDMSTAKILPSGSHSLGAGSLSVRRGGG